jgi:HK97 family phage portal protein
MTKFWRDLAKEFRDYMGSTVSFPADYFAGWFGVAPSESGVEVNELTAMQIAAFVGCVRVISGAIATLPFRVWTTLDDGSETIASDHILDNVLNNQPNPETTAADFWQTVIVHKLLTGNAYAEIAYNNAGQPAGLYLRSPFRTIPYRRPDGSLAYKTNDTPGQYERWIDAADMCQFRGMGMDGLVGLSPVKYYAREVLGNDLAAQSYSAKFFANDSRPGGYLKAANFIAPDKKKAAVESWIAAHSRGNSHSMAMLDGGLEWAAVGVNPDEAQFLQTRQFNRQQIAAIFGVPVHFLGDSESSRANMEQRGLEFLTYTVKPYIAKIEQVVNTRMFPKLGRHAGRYFARMDTTMFERAVYSDLLKGVQMGRYAGIYTVNEGRKLLGEQPYTKVQAESTDPADKLWMPVNMAYVSMDVTGTSDSSGNGAGKDGKGQGGNDQDGGDGSGKAPKATGQGGKREIEHYFRLFYPTFRDAFGRISTRKKVNEADFQKAFGPVFIQIASAFSLREDVTPEDFTLSEPIQHFLRDYIANFSRRVTMKGDLDELATEELRKTLTTLREACQPLSVTVEEAPDGEEDDDRSKPRQVKTRRVNLIKNADGSTAGAEILEQWNRKRRVKLNKRPDGTMDGADILEE